MQILSVALKNFKSHSDRVVTFQVGTNAICGENGAGKTSILEAIAWTLFNYRGGYKVEDLIRNGAGSAQATIAFVSNHDGRTYEVQRCTSRGYTLYDPQLGQRLDYKHIEDEVMPWLRQHLGVMPGTDLAKLFANTIGVPQGTFTADFLKTPEDRKKVFDAVLKVEEYKKANQDLLSLERYAKAQVERLEETIKNCEEELLGLEPLQQRYAAMQQEIARDEAQLKALEQTLAKLQAEKEQWMAIAQQVQQCETELQTVVTQRDAQQQAIAQLQQRVEQATQAATICQAHAATYQHYLQLEATLRELQQQQKARQQLRTQLDTKQRSLAQHQQSMTRLVLQRESLEKSAAEVAQLQPMVQQQIALERQQADLAQRLQQVQTQKLEAQAFTKQLTKLHQDMEQAHQTVRRLQSLADEVAQLPHVEHQRDRLQIQLSRVEAAKQFEAELQYLVDVGGQWRDRHQQDVHMALATLQQIQQAVPGLTTDAFEPILVTLQAGVQLNTNLLHALAQILTDLSEQTSVDKLQQQMQQVRHRLEELYRHQADYRQLDAAIARGQALSEEQTQVQAQLDGLQAGLAQEPDLLAQQAQYMDAIAQLGDPRSRCHLLERELQQLEPLKATLAQAHQVQTELEQAIAQLAEQLAEYAELDDQLDQQQQVQQQLQPGYVAYVQHQQAAQQQSTLEAELQQAIAQLHRLKTSEAELETTRQHLLKSYDPQQWAQLDATYTEQQRQTDRITGALPQQQKLLQELEQQLKAMQNVTEKRDHAKVDLKQRDKVRKFIAFSRKAYKEAGPRITERYLTTISKEADRLFRELMNRPNLALEWTRDYEVIVSEGANKRRFINLSGGEQMCAALAVRLALLRVLADVDVAFFDEPTTNMDRQRRQSLAEAIANIRSFRQVFVISHDDTFEQVTENIITIARDD
ncbi:AAA family ATPase [Leptolyngbya sp. AN02str]|uniref:AAA family ATPase n=1 Tax=Leptolyngbya sp. AN02str TaxID=3423363 RepID=UPI003D31452B